MRSPRAGIALLALAATTVLAPTAVADGQVADGPTEEDTGFRVQPYLQNPSTDGMTITWLSRTDEPAELTLIGPGVGGRAVYPTTPTEMPLLHYTDAELTQEIEGLEQGSWLRSGGNYKHTVELTGLRPGTRYYYSVRQGSETVRELFSTAPSADDWRSIRFVALSDSETEPRGRVLHREWAPGALAPGSLDRPSAEPGGAWDQAFGTIELSGVRTLRYMLTEDEGYENNLEVVERRRPDFVLMPGDLVQGGGYQPGWDEFFRHNAGETGNGLSRRPLIAGLGNWENFGALNGGYGTPEDRSPVVRSRAKYHAYIDAPGNGTPAHEDNYHRIDYGPITILTLDSSNGEPDDEPDNYPAEEKLTGQQYDGPGTDTQASFTAAEYAAAGGTDLADINPDSIQWEWAQEQLADAREQDQIIIVQFHHAAYSSGEHGLPMDHELTSGQGGTPMRQYHLMFERFGVAAVLSGHSEMFERSFVDEDGDGIGVHYYDVGVAGDGLRGEKRNGPSLNDPLLDYNPFSQWTADQDEPELWKSVRGVPVLVDGGKHYGHLEVNVERLPGAHGRGRDGEEPAAQITLTPVHVFPVLNADYEVVRTERREYGDEVDVYLDADGEVIEAPSRRR